MVFIYENIGLISIILLGMVMGSFITMASYRLSISNRTIKDLLLSPSQCPKCSNRLKPINLIPIFSWIFQRGKCYFCKSKIPFRYPLIEVISVISFVAIYFSLLGNINAKMILLMLISSALLLMIITDLEHYFISDINQIICFILVALYHFIVTSNEINSSSILYYFYSSVVYLIFGIILHFVFKLVTKKSGIGIDDIKFFVIAGFALGLDKFAVFMFLSGFLGVIFGLIWQKAQKDYSFPFAPALISSLIISFFINFDKWQLFY